MNSTWFLFPAVGTSQSVVLIRSKWTGMTVATTERQRWAQEGLLTPKAIAEYRERIGKTFSTEKRGRLRYASEDAIRAFGFSIGDDNPLWTDPDHGATSPWGEQIAPPSIPFAVFLGEMMSGLQGVHAFHSGCAWEFNAPVRAGDRLRAECTFVDVEEKSSDFAPVWLIGVYESVYRNQFDEIVAKVRSSQIRVERRAMRSSSGGTKRVVPHAWSPDELGQIEQLARGQSWRGSETRYFEDVAIGDKLPVLVKGPLRQTDVIAWLSATETLRSTNAGLREIGKHPGLGLLGPASNAHESIESVHWDNEGARSAGLPGAYDLGAQRQAFSMQSITDWMGDAGFLKKNECEYRKFVYLGDVMYFHGTVVGKYIDDKGEACIDIESKTLNQFDEDVMPSKSTVILPSREAGTGPSDLRKRTTARAHHESVR